ECRGGDEGEEVLPPATLLPPEAYKFPAYVTSPTQTLSRYSIPGISHTLPPPPAPPGGLETFPGRYYPREYLQHDPTYLQETSATSTLPPRTSITPPSTSACYSTMMNPHHLPCRDVEGNLPPPAGFLGPDRKRVSFARHLSCEDDAPSTPLLKKGESCV
ncbi:putative Nephrin-like 28, partial [Homarus americanus]